MEKIKLISGRDDYRVEKDVNDWLESADGKIDVISIRHRMGFYITGITKNHNSSYLDRHTEIIVMITYEPAPESPATELPTQEGE